MRTVSLASSQSCLSVDADAWCELTLKVITKVEPDVVVPPRDGAVRGGDDAGDGRLALPAVQRGALPLGSAALRRAAPRQLWRGAVPVRARYRRR